MFRRTFARAAAPSAGALADHRPADAITDRRLLVRCLVVLTGVVIGFVLHTTLHLEPSMVAMLGAGAMVLLSGLRSAQYLEGTAEWATLVYFMALFVLVGGLVQVGVIAALGQASVDVIGERYLLAATALLFGSAVLGAFVDNNPYTAAMAPIVEDLVAAVPDPAAGRPLWWAFALGADLGGNTTAIAAGANVVVTGLAAWHGQPICFRQFTRYGLLVTRYGLLVTAMTLVLAWVYVWLLCPPA
jgi:Na+/H+ antiporter NhaD/arsenite permease-like protein